MCRRNGFLAYPWLRDLRMVCCYINRCHLNTQINTSVHFWTNRVPDISFSYPFSHMCTAEAFFSERLASIVAGNSDEPGQSGGQRSCYAGPQGQECGAGGRGHRPAEPSDRSCHPVCPVHLTAGGLHQGTAVKLAPLVSNVAKERNDKQQICLRRQSSIKSRW